MLYSHHHDQLYKHICRCMQNHNDDTIKTSDTVLRKIYHSLYLKGLCVRGSWRPNRTAAYWPPTLLAITAFLSRSLGVLKRGPGGPASLGAGFLYRILSPTHLIPNWLNFLCAELYNSSRPPTSCGRHSFAVIQPVHGQGYNPDIPRPDALVIYTGAFPILTARPGRRSIYKMYPYLHITQCTYLFTTNWISCSILTLNKSGCFRCINRNIVIRRCIRSQELTIEKALAMTATSVL